MNIKVGDRYFQQLISQQEISEKVKDVARQITGDYRAKSPVFLCVLNGAFMFATDLLKQCDIPAAEISFIRLCSYQGTLSTGDVQQVTGITTRLHNRDVIIIEDIVDTGKTITELLKILADEHPSSVRLATFLSKPAARQHTVHIDYCCFEIPDKFVVGYGLDYDQLGRTLPALYAVAD